jgi:hypothetical protein
MTRMSRRHFVRLGAASAVAAPLVLDPTRVHSAVECVDRVGPPFDAEGCPIADVRCRWMPVGDPYWRPA